MYGMINIAQVTVHRPNGMLFTVLRITVITVTFLLVQNAFVLR